MSKETEYLQWYREQLKKKEQIEALLTEVRGLCDAMKTWQQATSAIPTMPDLASLSKLLGSYHSGAARLDVMWGNLARDERHGLCAPDTLQRTS